MHAYTLALVYDSEKESHRVMWILVFVDDRIQDRTDVLLVVSVCALK